MLRNIHAPWKLIFSLGTAAVIAMPALAPAWPFGQYDSNTSQYSMSANGRYVVFTTNNQITPEDTNEESDAYRLDLDTDSIVLISANSAEESANGHSHGPSISADGNLVAFNSLATNLVPGDTNGSYDVFLRDIAAGTTQRLSVDSSEGQTSGITGSLSSTISGDGTRVVFHSDAPDLVAGDTNNQTDIFLRNVSTGITSRVSVGAGASQAGSTSLNPAISSDGNHVVFTSYATNLVAGDTNGKSDVFVRNLTAVTTTRVSVHSSGAQANNDSFSYNNQKPTISADGSRVAFQSEASNLTASDVFTNSDIFVRDLSANTTVLASSNMMGVPAGSSSVEGTISADGTMVAFTSGATNLDPDYLSPSGGVYLKNLTTGHVQLISVSTSGEPGNSNSFYPSISANNSKVAFSSFASNFVFGDRYGSMDVFVRNLGDQTTTGPGEPAAAENWELY